MARKPWALLISIYVTQYMGVAFVMAAAVAILRQSGLALDRLALLNLIAIPIAGKIFYAPLIDHYRPFLRGQYRSWLILAQTVMSLMLLAVGFLQIQGQFALMLLFLLAYGFAVSVQDVAVDGLTCKIFEENKRQLASTLQYASNLVGNIVGGGLLLMFYPWLQWRGALWVLASLTALVCLQLLFFREPALATTHTHLKTRFKGLWREVLGFIRQHRVWFGLLLVYPVGFAAGFAILNPILVDAGWRLEDIGFATKVVGSLVGVVSAVMAAPLITWFGRKNALLCLTLAQAVGLLCMCPLALGDTGTFSAYLAITAFFLVNPALMATLSTLNMDRAARMQAKATFFTLQLSLIAFMGFSYAALGMVFAKHVGYFGVVLSSACLTVLMAGLAWKVLPNSQITVRSLRVDV